MKIALLSIFAVLIISPLIAAEDITMAIMLSNQNGKVNVESVELVEGSVQNIDFPLNDYKADVESLSGNISSVGFYFPERIFPEIESGEITYDDVVLEKSYEEVYFPYYTDVDKLKVYDANNTLVLEYDLSDYRVCNANGRCDLGEDEVSCPSECEQKKEAKEKVEQIAEKPKPEKKEDNNLILYLIILLILLAVFVIIIIKKRKK